MIRKGTQVVIRANCTKYPGLSGKVGIVTYVPDCVNDNFGVAISGKKNKLSKYGYFYLPFDQLSEIHNKDYNQANFNILDLLMQTIDGLILNLSSKPFPSIKNIYFNNPVTVVIWDDGTKTIVRCQKQTGDTYSKETGLAMCIAKKSLGNKGNYYDIFKKWIPELEDEYANRSCYNCKHRFGEDPECCVNCDRDFSNWDLVD